MADVRLTATNPDDSSVVPVACNAKGELKLEEPIEVPGPPGPPGDRGEPGEDGDPFSGNFADNVTFGGSAIFNGLVEAGGVEVTGGHDQVTCGISKDVQNSLILSAQSDANTPYGQIAIVDFGIPANVQISAENVSLDPGTYNLQVLWRQEDMGSSDIFNVQSNILRDTKTTGDVWLFRADCATQSTARKVYGFNSTIGVNSAPSGNAYAFFGGGNAPNFFKGSTYIGGTASRNTRELWESLLTEEHKEQLAAGTLAIPANVSTPGDGSFVRQWWYDEQSAEDQALIDSGELSYPKRYQPENFVDTFVLGVDTNINLLSNGSAEFAGDVVVGSRNKKWMLVEQNGLCHMVEQLDAASKDTYPELRDVFAELDVVEKALEEVMEKLRMTAPNGWPVWDGSDNKQEPNRLE